MSSPDPPPPLEVEAAEQAHATHVVYGGLLQEIYLALKDLLEKTKALYVAQEGSSSRKEAVSADTERRMEVH